MSGVGAVRCGCRSPYRNIRLSRQSRRTAGRSRMSKNGTQLSIYGHSVSDMGSLFLDCRQGTYPLTDDNPSRQVTIMAIILSIYSAILALALWQEKQNGNGEQQGQEETAACPCE